MNQKTQIGFTVKVRLDSLSEVERPQQLASFGKMLTDTVKMIAYRAETARFGLLRPHLAKGSGSACGGPRTLCFGCRSLALQILPPGNRPAVDLRTRLKNLPKSAKSFSGEIRKSEVGVPGALVFCSQRPHGVCGMRHRQNALVEREGFQQGSVLASYVHLHWALRLRAVRRFVQMLKRHEYGFTRPNW